MEPVLGTILLTSFLSFGGFGLAPGISVLSLLDLPSQGAQSIGSCSPSQPFDFA